MTTNGKKRILNEWLPAQIKLLIKAYNHSDDNSMVEVSYQLNKKFGTKRNTQAVSQRVVDIRRNDKQALRKRERGATYTSDEAVVFMKPLDAPGKKKERERKAEKAQPRRSSKARKNGRSNGQLKGDPMLANGESRVMEVDLGDKGKIRLEISGALLLNDQLVSNLTTAVGSALTV